MRKFFFIIMVFATSMLSAQIENEIKSFVDSTKILVFNGRELLSHNIINKKYEKAAEVYDYLAKATQDKNINAFVYNETIYLDILFRRWDSLAIKLQNFGEETEATIYPNMPKIGRTVYDAIIDDYDNIHSNLEDARIEQEQKDFLKLFLLLVKLDKPNELYNKKYKEFKKSYPATNFKKALNSYLHKPTGKYSLAIAMGASSMIPTGKIQSKFQQGWGAYMAADFNFEKIYISLFLAGGAFHAKDDFTVNDGGELIFEKDDYLNNISVGLSVGYFIKRSSKWHFTPFMGIANTTITSDKYNPDEDKPENDTKLYKSPSINTGIHTEYKLWEYTPKYSYYGTMPGYFSLKFDVSYSKGLKYKYDNLSGDYFMANLGIIIGMGDF